MGPARVLAVRHSGPAQPSDHGCSGVPGCSAGVLLGTSTAEVAFSTVRWEIEAVEEVSSGGLFRRRGIRLLHVDIGGWRSLLCGRIAVHEVGVVGSSVARDPIKQRPAWSSSGWAPSRRVCFGQGPPWRTGPWSMVASGRGGLGCPARVLDDGNPQWGHAQEDAPHEHQVRVVVAGIVPGGMQDLERDSGDRLVRFCSEDHLVHQPQHRRHLLVHQLKRRPFGVLKVPVRKVEGH